MKRYWVRAYELRDLGSWPQHQVDREHDPFGPGIPKQVILASDHDRLHAELASSERAVKFHQELSESRFKQLIQLEAELAELKAEAAADTKAQVLQDQVHHLREELARVREALEPFAALDIRHRSDMSLLSNQDNKPIFAINDSVITLGDVRKAQATIQPSRGEQG